MSGGWWRGRGGADAADPGARSIFLGHGSDLPATRLRLPPLVRRGAAGRLPGLQLPPARRFDCGDARFAIGTPAGQVGYVKRWRPRSVDLRPLLFARGPSPGFYPEPSDRNHGSSRVAEGDAAADAGRLLSALRPPPSELRDRTRDALARRLAAALQPPPETLLAPTGPLEWPGVFFPYQRDGIRALIQSPHLLLADDMGLGKSVQTIASLRLLLFRREIERALVVVPATLIEQWRRELALWAPELRVMTVHGSAEDRFWQWQYRAHVTITSYDTLRADAAGPSSGPLRETWGVVVLDEAQRIKNRDTEVARACRRLPRRRSWALTGTPLENRAEDLYSILEFVCGGEEARPLPGPGISLQSTLRELQLRRRKADVLHDLPPKIVTELVLPLTRPQQQAYERAEREGIVALRAGGELRVEHVLALITRLIQICNFAPTGDASAKMDDLGSRLDELTAEGHKALVFTQYTGDDSGARRIAERLRRFSPLLYTGDMAPWERSQVVTRFQQEDTYPVLILSLRAGGQGLNLQRASYVFHFDRSWNPAVERQAEDRAYRVGQKQLVHVYRYVMAGTIEERIDALLKSKAHLFDRLVDETSLDLSRLLDPRELLGLVGLDLPALASPVEGGHTGPPLREAPLPGMALEHRVAELLRRQGYHVEPTDRGRDGGVDWIAEKTDAVGARVRLFVQCKDTRQPLGVEAVRSLNGVLPPADRGVTGVVVCPAGFTPEARTFAHARNIQLWDAARLETLERGGGWP